MPGTADIQAQSPHLRGIWWERRIGHVTTLRCGRRVIAQQFHVFSKPPVPDAGGMQPFLHFPQKENLFFFYSQSSIAL